MRVAHVCRISLACVLALSAAFLNSRSAYSASIPNDVTYKIIEDKRVSNVKRTVYVDISKKVAPDVLEAIAYNIKEADRKSYQRTFIFYFLPGNDPTVGAWAYSHFDPNLEVKIMGATSEQEARLKSDSNKPNESILGDWLCTQPYQESRTILFSKNGKLYMKNTYKDGSGSADEVVERSSQKGRIFENKSGNSFGEYYVVTSSGALELWGRNGRFCTCRQSGR
jgi:hypothetical protein